LLRTSLAAIGLAAATTTGISFATTTLASATPIPTAARTAHSATAAPLVAHLTATPVATHPALRTGTSTRPATYTVQPGDCFWSIGQRYGVSMYTLADANHMQLSETLYVGRVLALPPAGAAAPTSVQVSASTPGSATDAAPTTKSAPTAKTVTHNSSGSVSAASGLEQCVIARESGGNPQARNGAYWGLYQFSASTWAAYGGNAGTYGSASAAEQQQVFHNAIARGGASNWTPYDGC
jgi:LysM repeat protein